jgi:hypothetical protein
MVTVWHDTVAPNTPTVVSTNNFSLNMQYGISTTTPITNQNTVNLIIHAELESDTESEDLSEMEDMEEGDCSECGKYESMTEEEIMQELNKQGTE